ncbi:MAG: ABC transporter substrate-binding protein [Mycobacteriales bacterium]
MQSFHKRRVLIAPVVLLALLGTACNNDKDKKTPDAAPSSAAPSSAAPSSTAPSSTAPGSEAPSSSSEAPKSEAPAAGSGTYSVFLSEPEHLMPSNTNESEGNLVLSGLFTGLISYKAEDSSPVNEMAESIESTDQKVWTIKIKPDWTFHNGEKVTAASYVDSWNYGALSTNAQNNNTFYNKIAGWADLQGTAADPSASPPVVEVAPKGKTMSGLKAVDDTTIEVTLTEPFSQFPLTLGYNAYYPMPKAALEGGADGAKNWEQAPVGNGPFMMDGKWEHDTSIKLKEFPDYKGTKAKAAGVEFKIYKEVTTAYIDAQAGNVDIIDVIPPEKIPTMEADFPGRNINYTSSTFTYMGFPLYDKRFGGDAKKDLRKALSMAIDREAITKTIFNGTRTPATSIISEVVAGSRKDVCKACVFNTEEAKKLYDAAGGIEGPITIWFNSGAGHEAWTEAVANMWKENLGVKDVKFKALDFAQYLPLVDEFKVDGPYRLGWGMDYPSPQNYLEPLYSTGASSNGFKYSNKEVDRLIQEGNKAASVDDGIKLYQQAEDLILEDMPNIPMFFATQQAVHTEKVANVVIDAFGNIQLANVEVK